MIAIAQRFRHQRQRLWQPATLWQPQSETERSEAPQ